MLCKEQSPTWLRRPHTSSTEHRDGQRAPSQALLVEAEGSSYCWAAASCCQDLLLGSAGSASRRCTWMLWASPKPQQRRGRHFHCRNNLGFSTLRGKSAQKIQERQGGTGGSGEHQLLCRDEPAECISHIQPCHLNRGKTSSVCLSVRAEGRTPPSHEGSGHGGSRIKQTQAASAFQATLCLFNPLLSQAVAAMPSHADPTRPASVAGSDFSPLYCFHCLLLRLWPFPPILVSHSASFTPLGAKLVAPKPISSCRQEIPAPATRLAAAPHQHSLPRSV